jgi:hypothetical protein
MCKKGQCRQKCLDLPRAKVHVEFQKVLDHDYMLAGVLDCCGTLHHVLYQYDWFDGFKEVARGSHAHVMSRYSER